MSPRAVDHLNCWLVDSYSNHNVLNFDEVMFVDFQVTISRSLIGFADFVFPVFYEHMNPDHDLFHGHPSFPCADLYYYPEMVPRVQWLREVCARVFSQYERFIPYLLRELSLSPLRVFLETSDFHCPSIVAMFLLLQCVSDFNMEHTRYQMFHYEMEPMDLFSFLEGSGSDEVYGMCELPYLSLQRATFEKLCLRLRDPLNWFFLNALFPSFLCMRSEKFDCRGDSSDYRLEKYCAVPALLINYSSGDTTVLANGIVNRRNCLQRKVSDASFGIIFFLLSRAQAVDFDDFPGLFSILFRLVSLIMVSRSPLSIDSGPLSFAHRSNSTCEVWEGADFRSSYVVNLVWIKAEALLVGDYTLSTLFTGARTDVNRLVLQENCLAFNLSPRIVADLVKCGAYNSLVSYQTFPVYSSWTWVNYHPVRFSVYICSDRSQIAVSLFFGVHAIPLSL